MRILVVDDHPKLRANVRTFLRLAGMESDEAVTGKEALELVRSHPYSAIVLDLNMPIMDGRTFLKEIRAMGDNTPVLALTSDSLTVDKVETLDAGADDYLTKPFEPDELVARIKAVARRREKPIESKSEIFGYDVDFDKMKIAKDGVSYDLPAKEWGVFEFLSKNRGVPKNKSEILEAVWGETEESLGFDSVTLEAHVSSLRKKL
ncbi:MAG: response regulator transcription factor [Patescibacteria group bacterium]